MTSSPPDPCVQPLIRLVLKTGVSLGGLPAPQRTLALALVWADLAAGPMSQRELDAPLRAQLAAGAAVWLDSDHVELRRWLVDTGWLGRDGFGREYRATPVAALAPGSATVARALPALLGERSAADWVRERREAHAVDRQRRHAAWAGAAGAAR